MNYLATSINSSAVITEKAGIDKTDFRGKAVKYDSNGDVVLAAAGEAVLGIGILTNDESTAKGADVDIQVKDIGVVLAGAATIKKGDELASDASGKLIKATAGQYVVGIALEASSAADTYIKAMISRYKTAAGT